MFKFYTSVASNDKFILVQNHPIIVFWGRSNVGKSSLINALCDQKISRTSKTPGRTQLINYFVDENEIFLVDLPGYGYAKMPVEQLKKMNNLVNDFFKIERSQKIVFLLIDSRLGIGKLDHEKLIFLSRIKVPTVLIYTKVDKLNQKDKSALIKKHQSFINENYNYHIINTFFVSSLKNNNIHVLANYLNEIIDN